MSLYQLHEEYENMDLLLAPYLTQILHAIIDAFNEGHCDYIEVLFY